jgi:predicted NBD/HSP70 family sugar kinase
MMIAHRKKKSQSMTIPVLGIDIGKNSCSVVGVDDKGAVIVRRSMDGRLSLNLRALSRPASSLDRQTPDQVYYNVLTPMTKAA